MSKKGFISEFKEFIMRGNVMDMAVGVIVGGAFTAIVTSLNEDILTPILGIFGGTDFSELKVTLGSGELAPTLYYGNFITAIINFLITALVIFCIIKGINRASERAAALVKRNKEEAEAAAPTEKDCPYCYSKININATRCPHCTSQL
ncbi:large conductance mechanosensitive channel [Pseudobutyrivibrio sp. OR37]|uniref:large conductance mechanosensitive channel protein MscL n=1 Tax=Pseudobutyrivibrio sp. OR37 TaxID=1798186 RepID=UPI0008EBAE01|nr:large conductance mechanosensitive channel protein MscL [Pseudobutyrivibrio sp. OR37]SFH64929.1 large conductance mechanosensitive channel [Pseudobutyrivibrio sp. OR37]